MAIGEVINITRVKGPSWKILSRVYVFKERLRRVPVSRAKVRPRVEKAR